MHSILVYKPSQKVQFQGRVWLFYGQNTKGRLEKKIKTPNKLKVIVLKQVSKNLLPDKFSGNRFFLSCIGISDRYSKSLLNVYGVLTNLTQISDSYKRNGYKLSAVNIAHRDHC